MLTMNRRALASLIAVISCFTVPCMAQTADQVDSGLPKALETEHVVGATVAIVKDGHVTEIRGFGKRELASGIAADAYTKYEVGSVTKEFTAAAILQLREAGKLSLDASLATYLPAAPHAKDVSIRQLLTLTSGLPNYLAGPNVAALAATPATFDQLMARIAGKPFDFSPGTQFGASNTNYLILGRVVEVASGLRWSDYVEQHLFAPAGMTETSTIGSETRLHDMARGFVYTDGRTSPAPPLDESWAVATGDIVTTAGDLVKWDAALASGKIVNASDYALMTTSHRLADGSSTGYGMGMYVDNSNTPRILAQGDTFGFDASDVFYPNQGLRIIVLTNTEGGSPGTSASIDIGDAVYDELQPPSSASETSSASAKALYAAAVRTMDEVRQPPFVTYTLEGASDTIHIGLTTAGHQVWLRFSHGNGSTMWTVKHRTQDYESEVLDGKTRYVSQRSLFDPTWFGAFRALRDGMLGFQDVEASRSSFTVAQATPAPDAALHTIASVSVIGSGIYKVDDRGPAPCSNGDPGHALHLTAWRRNPERQLTDVVVDLRSMRFCTIRFEWNEALWFDGIVEQRYAEIGGYWMVTDGSIYGKLSILGIPTHRFAWQYQLTDITFPDQIPGATFIPDPTQ
jgi:CubicO group peptidase (beta-lactamase class C family)